MFGSRFLISFALCAFSLQHTGILWAEELPEGLVKSLSGRLQESARIQLADAAFEEESSKLHFLTTG